jgi:hypothetical protein
MGHQTSSNKTFKYFNEVGIKEFMNKLEACCSNLENILS